MSWQSVFLGIIAAATLAMALVQVAVIIVTGLVARRLTRLADRLERELTPLFAHLNAIGQEAARAASLATAQVERVDRLFSDLVKRLEETLRILQSILRVPLREGSALLAALQAVLGILRDRGTRRGRSRTDEEDALFI